MSIVIIIIIIIPAMVTVRHLPQSSRRLACTSFADKFALTFPGKKVTKVKYFSTVEPRYNEPLYNEDTVRYNEKHLKARKNYSGNKPRYEE